MTKFIETNSADYNVILDEGIFVFLSFVHATVFIISCVGYKQYQAFNPQFFASVPWLLATEDNIDFIKIYLIC